MNFNSRETYLVAVAAWKIQHAEQIKIIRAGKLALKNAHRALEKDRKTIGDVWSALIDLRKARERMIELQTERADGKHEAQKHISRVKQYRGVPSVKIHY